jgi:hypothetical protein
MNISVRNFNSYQLKIEAIDLSAFVMANASQINQVLPFPSEQLFARIEPNRKKVDDSNRKQKIGTGARKEPITFPPNGQEIQFTMNFKVEYSPNKQLGALNDPAMNEIIQLCVVPPILPPGQNRTTTIRYEAQTDIAALRWSPIKPNVGGELNINCPFQGSARDSFIAAIKGQGNSRAGAGAGTGVPSAIAGSGFRQQQKQIKKLETIPLELPLHLIVQ